MESPENLKIDARQYANLARDLKQKRERLQKRYDALLRSGSQKIALRIAPLIVKIQAIVRGVLTRRRLKEFYAKNMDRSMWVVGMPDLRQVSEEDLARLICNHLKKRSLTLEMVFRCCDQNYKGFVPASVLEDFLVKQIIVVGKSRRGQRLPQVTPMMIKRFVSLMDGAQTGQVIFSEVLRLLFVHGIANEKSDHQQGLADEIVLKLLFLLRFKKVDEKNLYNLLVPTGSSDPKVKRENLVFFLRCLNLNFTDREIDVMMLEFDPLKKGFVDRHRMEEKIEEVASQTVLPRLLECKATIEKLQEQKKMLENQTSRFEQGARK